MSRAGVAEAARAAATFPVTEGAGTLSAVVRLFGQAVGMSYTPDRAEVARRATVGLGSITRGTQGQQAFTAPVMDSPVADDPAEPTSRNEHESQAIVKDELEGLPGTPSSAKSPTGSKPRPCR